MAIVGATISVKDPDFLKGREIMHYFNYYNLKAYPSTYKVANVDDLIKSYSLKGPILAQGLGRSFRLSGVSIDKAKSAMQKLSKDSKGRVPTWQAFTDYLTGQLTQRDYFQIAKEVTVESVKTIAEGVMTTGESVIAGAKLGQYLIRFAAPIALGLLVFYVYKKSQQPIIGSSSSNDQSLTTLLKAKARKMLE